MRHFRILVKLPALVLELRVERRALPLPQALLLLAGTLLLLFVRLLLLAGEEVDSLADGACLRRQQLADDEAASKMAQRLLL